MIAHPECDIGYFFKAETPVKRLRLGVIGIDRKLNFVCVPVFGLRRGPFHQPCTVAAPDQIGIEVKA